MNKFIYIPFEECPVDTKNFLLMWNMMTKYEMEIRSNDYHWNDIMYLGLQNDEKGFTAEWLVDNLLNDTPGHKDFSTFSSCVDVTFTAVKVNDKKRIQIEVVVWEGDTCTGERRYKRCKGTYHRSSISDKLAAVFHFEIKGLAERLIDDEAHQARKKQILERMTKLAAEPTPYSDLGYYV